MRSHQRLQRRIHVLGQHGERVVAHALRTERVVARRSVPPVPAAAAVGAAQVAIGGDAEHGAGAVDVAACGAQHGGPRKQQGPAG